MLVPSSQRPTGQATGRRAAAQVRLGTGCPVITADGRRGALPTAHLETRLLGKLRSIQGPRIEALWRDAQVDAFPVLA